MVFKPSASASARRTTMAKVLLNPSGASTLRPHAAVRVAQRRERGVRLLDDRLLQDRGERGAGVFDVGVDVARSEWRGRR